MNWDKYEEIVEQYARWLCEKDYKCPDDYYEEFDRNAAACLTHSEDYEGWEEDVFPKTYLWEEYKQQAQRAVSYFVGEPE